jgi:hypothetical protein
MSTIPSHRLFRGSPVFLSLNADYQLTSIGVRECSSNFLNRFPSRSVLFDIKKMRLVTIGDFCKLVVGNYNCFEGADRLR